MSTTTGSSTSLCICTHYADVHGGAEHACIAAGCSCRSYYPAKLATRTGRKRLDNILQWGLFAIFATLAVGWVVWYLVQEFGR